MLLAIAAISLGLMASPVAADFRPEDTIPGQLSKASPALAEVDGQLHMVHLGDTSNDIWHSVWDGSGWSENERIPGQLSKATPALAEVNGQLHMVHLGDTSNDIWHSVWDGSGWSDNERVPGQRSKASPALAEFNGQLHMVHLGDTSNDIWHSTWDGSGWSDDQRIPGQLSKATPALAVFAGQLHMAHLGDTSNDIWHSVWDGSGWSDNERIPGQLSKVTPALAGFAGQLHMVHLGDTSNDIWHSVWDGSGWSDNERVPRLLENRESQRSHASPALAGNGQLHMVHLGDSSNNIWHSQFDLAYVYPRCDLGVAIDFVGGQIVATGERNCRGTDPPAATVEVRVRKVGRWGAAILPDETLADETFPNVVSQSGLRAALQCNPNATTEFVDFEGVLRYYAVTSDGASTRSEDIFVRDC